MATTNSTKIPFEIFYGEKPKIISLLSEFRRIAYVTKKDKIKGQIKDTTCKAVMVGYT